MDPFEKFCIELRAVVVSSPVPVDSRSLKRDYELLVGEPMPLQRFGYKNFVAFLREQCWRFFLLEGAPNNPIVTLIVPKALEHIDRMVQHQNLSARDSKKGRRWNIKRSDTSDVGQASATNLGCSGPSSGRIPTLRTLAARLTELIADYPEGLWVLDMITIYSLLQLEGAPNNPIVTLIVPKALEHIDRMVQHQNLSARDSKKGRRWNIKRSDTSDVGQASATNLGCSGPSSGRIPTLRTLAARLTELIADYPEGLWVLDMITIYRKRYGQNLCYEQYGFRSGIELLYCLEGIVFHIRRPDPLGDRRVYDARLPPPPDDPLEAPVCTPSTSTADEPSSDTIRSESIVAFESSMMIDVIVSHVYSPSHFWVIRRDDQHGGLLFRVLDVMTEYYDRGEGAELSLADEMEVRPGVYCAARCNDMWYRALVLKLLDPNTALVRYIDYGTVDCAPINSLKPLLKYWKDIMPAQAIRARLAGVIPPSRVPYWPRTSSAEFLRIAIGNKFIAEIVAVDHKENIMEIFLVDTSEACDVCVNDWLIQQGFAAECFHSVFSKNERYLWPTFETLESGLTLSYADICEYIEHDVHLKFIDLYRQYVLDPPIAAVADAAVVYAGINGCTFTTASPFI